MGRRGKRRVARPGEAAPVPHGSLSNSLLRWYRGWELLDIRDEDLARCVNTAVELLSAERIDPGEYAVVASPWVTGTLVHESFGHGVETDMFLKERAKAAEYLDEVVGSPMVNIWDDPSYPRGFGSYFFDDEGMLAGPTQIVEDGVYLEMWSSRMEDPQGWGIQVTCHYGHEIKNGHVTERMYAPIGITGYIPDVLAK